MVLKNAKCLYKPEKRLNPGFTSARIYRPSFRKPKTLVLNYYWKRAFWDCFRENWVYKFGQWSALFTRRLVDALVYITKLLQVLLKRFLPPAWKGEGLFHGKKFVKFMQYGTSILLLKNIEVVAVHWKNASDFPVPSRDVTKPTFLSLAG